GRRVLDSLPGRLDLRVAGGQRSDAGAVHPVALPGRESSVTDHGFGVVRPLPGNGLVAHTGGLLLVCDAAEAVVSDLLAAVRETAATGGDGRALARRVAQALARSMTTEPASCAVAGPANGGVAVLVSGEASATVKAESGEVTLAGRDALTWTDRLVPGPVHHVELHLPGAGEAHPQAR